MIKELRQMQLKNGYYTEYEIHDGEQIDIKEFIYDEQIESIDINNQMVYIYTKTKVIIINNIKDSYNTRVEVIA